MGFSKADVIEVNRPHPVATVKPTDFVLKGRGEVDLSELVQNPRYSLYCFDLETQEAVFVELADPVAADAAAFYYQAQAEQARAVVRLPMEVFHQAALQIPEVDHRAIFIHSVGRCGSTLMSKIIAAVPSVYSLSEPDDLTQLVNFAGSEGSDKDWVKRAMASSVRWRLKPHSGAPTQILALKTRSEVLVLTDAIAENFPVSKHLFLYRDGIDWMGSVYKAWPPDRDPYDPDLCQQIQASWANTIPLVAELLRDGVKLNALETRVQAWITCMEGYLKLRDQGLSTCAIRYQDLSSNPRGILPKLFEFCGLGEVDWALIDEVLGKDSQAGTMFDREKRTKVNMQLTDKMVKELRACIAVRPQLVRSDVVLPGTLLPG